MPKDADAATTHRADRHREVRKDCQMGMHSWIHMVGRLPPDTKCDHCDELYGDPT